MFPEWCVNISLVCLTACAVACLIGFVIVAIVIVKVLISYFIKEQKFRRELRKLVEK